MAMQSDRPTTVKEVRLHARKGINLEEARKFAINAINLLGSNKGWIIDKIYVNDMLVLENYTVR